MATKDTEKFLKDLIKFVGENVRSNLNNFYTVVTMTDESLGQGFKEGYQFVQKARPERDFPEISDEKFTEFGSAAIDAVIKHVEKPRTWPTKMDGTIPGKQVVYGARRDLKGVYSIAKNKGVQLLNKYLKESGKDTLRNLKQERDSGIGAAGGKVAPRTTEIGIFKSGLHRTHKGVTTVGAAQLTAGMNFLDKTKDFAGFTSSQEFADIMKIYPDIEARFTTTGTKKKGGMVELKEDQQVEIYLGPKSENFAGSEATDWKNLKPQLMNAIREYLDKIPLEERSGSKSIRENAEEVLEYTALKKILEIDGAKLVKGKLKVSTRKKQKVSQKRTNKTAQPGASTKKAAPFVAKRGKRKGTQSPSRLMALINAKLPQTVAANMGAPALENRTGRFASSPRVVDVTSTPQGFPSIGYTYQKNPYSVFEKTSGTRFASAERDPRDLIELSIREIAAQLTIGRFYTRRV